MNPLQSISGKVPFEAPFFRGSLAATRTLAVASAALVAACGGGAVFIGDGVGVSVNVPPPNDGGEVLTAAFPEPAGRNCASGGTRVDAGTDSNRNGVLDEQEVQSTRYVCSGQDAR